MTSQSEYDRREQVRSKPKTGQQKLVAVYARLPATHAEWLKKEAFRQDRTIQSILSIMVDDARKGRVFEKV